MTTYLLIIALVVILILMALVIANRQRAARAFNSKLRLLQTLMNSIPSPIFYKDKNGVYQGCNSAFLEMLGRTEEEVVGKTVYDISPRDLAEVYEKADNDLFAQGGEQRYETKVKFADGSRHDIFFTKAVIRDGAGKVAGLLGVMLDISERKRAEEELRSAHSLLEQKVQERTKELNESNIRLEQTEKASRAQKEFLEKVINSIDYGIVVVNADDYTVKHANASASGGEFREGIRCYELLHKRLRPCAKDDDICPLHLVKESGEPAVTQHEHIGEDGEIHYLETHTYPVFDESGNMPQIIISIMDVSERKRAEIAIVEAKEMAEATSSLMSEFLETTSHELRTPMTSVQGFAKLSLKSFQNTFVPMVDNNPSLASSAERIEENLSIIISESDRMTALINNQLDLSKLQSGTVEWHQSAVLPMDLLEKTENITSSLFIHSPVEFVVECDEGLPMLIADGDKLLQVMLNLVSNAVKFTEQGTIVCKAALGQGAVVFSVSDTGKGIPLDQQDAVFDKFKQIKTKETGKPAGTGLGLAITKKIVEHHGGEIWIESEEGKGSTFFFTIPLGM
ncbi:PAS domain-containing sensor histidine kinase [Pseudodesulfovibrio sp. zrk46]|uniref:PAS domain-containing sensor histidine kinase n=1 Tax=Pseudodesulfovibrio sp. zrk46 TaxID=2725288 RepID=UPI001448F766|nr:PAS domain-containing sensor histidine kinase [Pseudodesulfovibrio sp. zrk46]QJB56407.1 PAS domain S-box protein [Pseudodesulfovibrio sp. zrk46]